MYFIKIHFPSISTSEFQNKTNGFHLCWNFIVCAATFGLLRIFFNWGCRRNDSTTLWNFLIFFLYFLFLWICARVLTFVQQTRLFNNSFRRSLNLFILCKGVALDSSFIWHIWYYRNDSTPSLNISRRK